MRIKDEPSWHPPQLKYWMPIHYDTIKNGQNKKSHLLFSNYIALSENNTSIYTCRLITTYLLWQVIVTK